MFMRFFVKVIKSYYLSFTTRGDKKIKALRKLVVCRKCKSLSKKGFCGECGCYMKAKIFYEYAECDLNKW